MLANKLSIRPANCSDLNDINAIISACVMDWNLPHRVKRLAVGSYQYQSDDLNHQNIYVAVTPENKLLAVIALESASTSELPVNYSGFLLHGIYVDPIYQKQGIGELLIKFSMQKVKESNLQGLLVKAQASANSYFKKLGFDKLPVINPDKDYPHRWWKILN